LNTNCPNCGASVGTPFCGRCGQPRSTALDLPTLFRGSFARLLDLEGGFLHTFFRLSMDPGIVCRDYVGGRRKPYTHPVSYCFLLVTLYALMINLLGVEVSFGGAIEFGDTERSLYRIVHGILAYLLFFTLLPVAALQRRLFASSGNSMADSYVFALFVIGHSSVIGITFAAGG
jgi:phosphate starvation-inducible membrane PsiE